MRKSGMSRQSFWDTPLYLTLAVWLCSVPLTAVVVGSIWGLWPAAMAALAMLVIMLAICLALCWEPKNGIQSCRMNDLER